MPKPKTKKVRKYTHNINKLRRTQGCLTDCVAYYFNLHPEYVPFFLFPRKTWMKRLRYFFKRRGFTIWWGPYAEKRASGLRIVTAPSMKWRSAHHAVVYRGKSLVYDPNFPSTWGKTIPTHELIITPLPKSPKKRPNPTQ